MEKINEQLIRMKSLMGINESIEPQDGYQLYFHGGNLDVLDTEANASRVGSIVYGLGLYLTTSRTVANKYAKGSRKLYVVKVKDDIKVYNDVDISKEIVANVFTKYLSKPKHKLLLNYLERVNPLDVINAHNLNVFLLNQNMINKANIKEIGNFFLYQDVDGDIDYSPFGYGEKQLVLINFKKIESVQRIAPNDSNFYDDFTYTK